MVSSHVFIHTSCSHHLEQVARALLENEAAVNSQNKKGSTALTLAAQNGHEQVCSSQFEYVDSCIQLRCAHFHTFSSHHLEQVVRALLENGAAVNSQANNGFTALMLAAQNGHDQVHSSQFEYVDSCRRVTVVSSSHLLFTPSRSGRPRTARE